MPTTDRTCYNEHVDRADDNDAPIVERVSARAALAGNPSDGYSGAVFAIPVNSCAATVHLRPAPRWSVSDQLSGTRTFDDQEELHQVANGLSADDPHALVLATTVDFLVRTGVGLRPCSVDVSSSIPVSVGLAGSSAIVLAVLRALYRAAHVTLPRHWPLASIALGVETQRLGIAAGMQDRLVQAYGRPVLMRFDTPGQSGVERGPGSERGSAEIVQPGTALRFLVAHRQGLSEPSQVVHGDLRRRFDADDQTVRAAMSQLLAHAIAARDAFSAGDAVWLGESMDATYALRANMIDLVPGHVEMVKAARSVGASANYTGSGGAIVVLSPSDDVEAAARQSLKRLGCEIVSVDAAPNARGPSRSPTAPRSPG